MVARFIAQLVPAQHLCGKPPGDRRRGKQLELMLTVAPVEILTSEGETTTSEEYQNQRPSVNEGKDPEITAALKAGPGIFQW